MVCGCIVKNSRLRLHGWLVSDDRTLFRGVGTMAFLVAALAVFELCEVARYLSLRFFLFLVLLLTIDHSYIHLTFKWFFLWRNISFRLCQLFGWWTRKLLMRRHHNVRLIYRSRSSRSYIWPRCDSFLIFWRIGRLHNCIYSIRLIWWWAPNHRIQSVVLISFVWVLESTLCFGPSSSFTNTFIVGLHRICPALATKQSLTLVVHTTVNSMLRTQNKQRS